MDEKIAGQVINKYAGAGRSSGDMLGVGQEVDDCLLPFGGVGLCAGRSHAHESTPDDANQMALHLDANGNRRLRFSDVRSLDINRERDVTAVVFGKIQRAREMGIPSQSPIIERRENGRGETEEDRPSNFRVNSRRRRVMRIMKLNRLLYMQRRRQIRARNRKIASGGKRKASLSQLDDNLLVSQIKGYSGPNLPQDIWCYIHSLMPMRDAAQVACVSKAFVRSWRCHPNLDFHEKTLGLNKNTYQHDTKSRDFNTLVDRIMKNHSCIGVKSLKFHFPKALVSNKGSCRLDGLESLLLSIVKPGIKELSLNLTVDGNYKFPCSLLSDGNGDQLRCLFLACCHFRPTVAFGCLRSLTKLQLTMVHITASELGCLLFGSFALEHLELRYCSEIVRLKIPFLKQLSHLGVVHCNRLRAIESKAPNLSSICFIGDLKVQLLLAKACHIKKLDSSCNNFAFYARTELPSSMPNLEALTINSYSEMVSTPMAPSRFLHLSFLRVALGGLNFDYLSLISFLDASPSLETFILEVHQERKVRLLVFEDLSDLRILPKHHYSKLKVVKIIKFSSAKSVVELTCHILESTPSLKRLTLDTTHGLQRCSVSKSGKCIFMLKDALAEAHRGLLAAQTYIKPKVPSTVELNVLEPCSQCHAVGL